jgi:RHS repeat-associated protein
MAGMSHGYAGNFRKAALYEEQAHRLTAAAGARNLFKVDAGVVHALLQARYYDGTNGEFLSEDPSFLAVGNPGQLKQLTQQEQQQFLLDPQQMNSYSYGRDNPISKSDPLGLDPKLFSSNPLLASLELYGYISLLNDANSYFNKPSQSAAAQNSAKAQFQVDSVVTAAGFLGSTAEAAGLTIAGTVLQGVDAYCSGHTCQDFSTAAKTTPASILGSLRPKPGVVPSPYGLTNSTTNYASQGQRSAQSGGSITGSAGAQFLSNLRSFATALSAYVASLSPKPANNANNKQ